MSTVVITPTTPDPIRPPLECVRAAEAWEAQMIAGVAEEFGIAVILPLFVDVDRGGPLAQRELRQVLDEAIKSQPPIGEHGVVPVGVCGGAISAMRFAQCDPRISAVVLNSPEVFRDRTRLAVPDSITDPVNRSSELEFTSLLEALSSVPVYVMFDSALPGHGDRPGTARLITELRAFGGKVKAVWPPAIDEYVWGERDRSRYGAWFDWVVNAAKVKRSAHTMPESSITAKASALTIQSALLQGFSVSDTVDPLLADFRKRWLAKLRLYRGAEPRHHMDAATTHVVFERVTQSLPSPKEQSEGASEEVAALHEPEFSVRLKTTGSGYEIAIRSTNVPAGVSLPPIDILTEGLYRDMTWRYSSDSWRLSSTDEKIEPH